MQNFRGKKVLIVGLGQWTGKDRVGFFIKKGAKVIINDQKPLSALRSYISTIPKKWNIVYKLGAHKKEFLNGVDYVVKNSAIPWTHPFIQEAIRHKIPVETDVTLFFKEVPSQKIIGVTGSKGKSTTAALIYNIIQQKYKAVFAGNIGISLLTKINQAKKVDWAIAELSSFNLQDLAYLEKSPHIAVITSLFPEHLNYHKNFSEYADAKANIFRFQKRNDVLIFNERVSYYNSNRYSFPWKTLFYKDRLETNKNGVFIFHQQAGKIIGKILKIPEPKIQLAIDNFKTQQFRLEKIKTFKNLTFINDSAATTPEATAWSLLAIAKSRIKNYELRKKENIILIFGGTDKNFKKSDFKNLYSAARKIQPKIFLISGSATEKFKRWLPYPLKKLILYESDNLEKIVKKIISSYTTYTSYAIPHTFLFSPGAASFELFRNEADRGVQFNELAKNLLK